MGRHEGGPPKRPDKRAQRRREADVNALDDPKYRLEVIDRRIERLVQMAPLGINKEALLRYVESESQADRDESLGDATDSEQTTFLSILDRQLQIRGERRNVVQTGIEIISPPDLELEARLEKLMKVANPVIRLGASKGLVNRYTTLGDQVDAALIWNKIKDRPNAEDAMRALIKTVEETLYPNTEHRSDVIDMGDLPISES